MINQSSRMKLTDSSWSQSGFLNNSAMQQQQNAAKLELAKSRFAQNEGTGNSIINPLGSESDNTGFALANALDKSGNTAGGTTEKS